MQSDLRASNPPHIQKAAMQQATTASNVVPRSGALRNQLHKRVWIAWIPLAVLPLVCIALRSALIPWELMWLLAGTIFVGCKWQTWWEADCSISKGNWRHSAAYLLLWPGMNAQQFLNRASTTRPVRLAEWLAALLKTLAGAALVAAAKSPLLAHQPFLEGWIGMIGIVLVLHFGAFYFIALTWQSLGVHADPIMRRPLQSQSLSELWGKRWNMGFRDLSHKLVFRPLRRRYGVAAATLSVFLLSGLLHDVVISVPAKAGFGLPTAYFLAQGVGVTVERSPIGKRLRLGSGIRGRMWAALVAVGPVPILFHPWFVMRVVVPFLNAI